MIASFTPRLGLSTLALVGLAAPAGVSISAPTAEEAHKIPPPAPDEPAPAAGSEIAVVAGAEKSFADVVTRPYLARMGSEDADIVPDSANRRGGGC